MTTQAKDELVLIVHLQVTEARDGRWSATADLGGHPFCTYGPSEEEAKAKTQGAVLRFLAGALDRGVVKLEAVRFKTKRA